MRASDFWRMPRAESRAMSDVDGALKGFNRLV